MPGASGTFHIHRRESSPICEVSFCPCTGPSASRWRAFFAFRGEVLTRNHYIISMIRLLLVLVFLGTAAQAQVRVRDADTIVVDGTPVRLNGVDAPENSTRYGRDATRWMVRYLNRKSVTCELNGERTHDRWVGVCYADGEDIGAAVIAAGHALDCRRYSKGRYRHLETPAAKSRLRRAKYCR